MESKRFYLGELTFLLIRFNSVFGCESSNLDRLRKTKRTEDGEQ